MMPGRRLGEIVRLVLVKLSDDGLVFSGANIGFLKTANAFFTKYVLEIVRFVKFSS